MNPRTVVREVVGGRVHALPPRHRPPCLRGRDDGMVLLETALAVPLLVAVAALLAWALTLGATSLALGDAARAAARDIARGEPASDALARAAAAVPGARSELQSGADAAVVVMTTDVRAPVPLLSGMPVTVSQRVAIPKEWT